MRDKGKHGEARGDKGRQDLGKAGTSSIACTYVGRQWETSWETRGDKNSGMRTHHPTQALVGKANTPSNTGTHVGRQWEAMGDNESNGRHWETMGDKER